MFLLPVYRFTALFCSHMTEIPRRKVGDIGWNFSSIFHAAGDVVSCGLDVCDIYFRYKTTSYNTNLSTVELLDLENIGIAVAILLLCALKLLSRYDVSHKLQQMVCIFPVLGTPY